MLYRYIEKMSKLYDKIDGIVIVDKNGFVVHYQNNNPDLNHLTQENVVNKHVLDIWTNLTEGTSTILNVLKTKKPVLNVMQSNKTFLGDEIHSINSAMPITDQDGQLIGAVDVSIYRYSKEYVQLPTMNMKNQQIFENQRLFTLDDILTNSSNLNQVKENISRISKTNSSVLIYGETGSGKELVAQAIHTASERKQNNFIAQNCAAIPSTLLESILFGTVKGTFTGAENRIGLFEQAQGGTLFLDEINSMDIAMQAKILRVLENKKIRKVGGSKEIKLDIRFVFAVNENPMEMLSGNRMRKDLFYRISPVQINIPPLRERRNDILLLANHFIEFFNKSMEQQVLGVTEPVIELFSKYYWPGNVREFKNVIEGCFNIMSGMYISLIDLPMYMKATEIASDTSFNESSLSLKENVENYEKQLIQDAIIKNHSLVKTANYLRVSKQNLRHKMEKYRLEFL